jgi:hypothetical protein
MCMCATIDLISPIRWQVVVVVGTRLSTALQWDLVRGGGGGLLSIKRATPSAKAKAGKVGGHLRATPTKLSQNPLLPGFPPPPISLSRPALPAPTLPLSSLLPPAPPVLLPLPSFLCALRDCVA